MLLSNTKIKWVISFAFITLRKIKHLFVLKLLILKLPWNYFILSSALFYIFYFRYFCGFASRPRGKHLQVHYKVQTSHSTYFQGRETLLLIEQYSSFPWGQCCLCCIKLNRERMCIRHGRSIKIKISALHFKGSFFTWTIISDN